MNKGSRARRESRIDRPAVGRSGGAPSSSPSSANLGAALALAAETSSAMGMDPVAVSASRVDRDDPPRSVKAAPSQRAARAPVEEDFFAQGEEIGSVAPSSYEPPEAEIDEATRRKAHPHVVARRARMQRFVGWVVGAAALLTVLVSAKALLSHPEAMRANDNTLSMASRVMPSIALGDPAKTDVPSEPVEEKAVAPMPTAADVTATPDVPVLRKLPVVDVEIPETSDERTVRGWMIAAERLTSGDFKAADEVFAELARSADVATREAARLARAAWWMANGKRAQVRPVVADLAAKATTASVQRQARELLESRQ